MSGAPQEDGRLAEDAAARGHALDPTRSFLVQAPAGSGKTELLIQRLLALLARVERPERVLAITFTRKAAGEMRDRVVRALVAAADATVDEAGLKPHERTTRSLARAVLAQDAKHGWQLIDHPTRLAIQTIDALAQAIARQAPLASGLPASPRFTDDAMPLYVAAAHAAIAAADPGRAAWRLLLDHQDNDANALAAVIATLLRQRDQWRSLVVKGGDIRAALESALVSEVEGELALVASALGGVDLSCIFRVASAARQGDLDDAALRGALEACIARGGPASLAVEHLAEWRAISSWLMTKDGKGLRKSAASMAGIPAIGRGEGANARRDVAREVAASLASLAGTPGLEEALATLLLLPPIRYTDDEWARIEALLALMPELAAHLEAVFAQQRELDFPKATLAALTALGDDDEPTALMLRLDLRIDHLLVDEFQDTSFAHLELIRKLVAGWSDGDGRTIFAVGDPMQSIYRFRGAEVRAFVDAQVSGSIEGVPVECLTLRRNFRSQAGLVDWVNATFPAVLGARSDPWRGRVAFADAVAQDPSLDGVACTIDVAANDHDEAAMVVQRTRDALAAGGSVAILVRARGHLGALLPALRAAGIAYAAVDLDVLGDRPAVRDLVALTHAIVQPDDRLAWLAVLRAPWCGLALADLHAIVQATDAMPGRTIESVVHAPPTLSSDGAARLARCAAVLRRAGHARGQRTLDERVRAAWLALGGPATLADPLDLVAVDDVLTLVAAHERAGDLPDWSAFAARIAEQRLSPPPGEAVRVQVMTMHKAKGLEFDTVILPGLSRGRSRSDTPLLRFRSRPRGGLLLGLAKPRGGEHDGVYAYLRDLAAGEEEAELGRLAYVACTRAKQRLALIAVLDPDEDGQAWKSADRASILGRLDLPRESLPALRAVPAVGAETMATATIERLPLAWRAADSPAPLVHPLAPRAVEPTPPFDWARERTRRLGVVVHRVLAQVAAEGLDTWNDARLDAHVARIVVDLIGEGALPGEAPNEAADVRATIAGVLRDPRGRWLFDPAHTDARSEWALAGVDGSDIVHIAIDRTFVTEGVRWIVDFKTGTHEGGDPGAFLDREMGRYSTQLERYARIVAGIDPAHPIKLALYHPRVPRGWRVIR